MVATIKVPTLVIGKQKVEEIQMAVCGNRFRLQEPHINDFKCNRLNRAQS